MPNIEKNKIQWNLTYFVNRSIIDMNEKFGTLILDTLIFGFNSATI